MQQTGSLPIVILERRTERRQRLRTLVKSAGFAPICFEKKHLYFENLTALQPQLALMEPDSLENAALILYLTRDVLPTLPILFLAESPDLFRKIMDKGFKNVSILPNSLNHTTLAEVIMRKTHDAGVADSSPRMPVIVGNSQPINTIRNLLPELGASNEAVLITGEPGTGKELIVRAIHAHSNPPEHPIVKLDCEATTPELFENVLFHPLSPFICRHCKDQKELMQSPKMTIFLDKIESLPPSVQAQMLLLLDQPSRLNITQSLNNDLPYRFIATARQDIKALEKMGKIRKDLYYRLDVVELNLPPLRCRSEDVPALIDYFRLHYYRRSGISYPDFSKPLMDLLLSYHWPGNVQELKDLVKRAIVTGDTSFIINNSIISSGSLVSASSVNQLKNPIGFINNNEIRERLRNSHGWTLKEICSEYTSKAEKMLIHDALSATRWNRRKAANLLRISYKSLLNKISAYKLV
jgi:DNA-binding NtrC family response regulator